MMYTYFWIYVKLLTQRALLQYIFTYLPKYNSCLLGSLLHCPISKSSIIPFIPLVWNPELLNLYENETVLQSGQVLGEPTTQPCREPT